MLGYSTDMGVTDHALVALSHPLRRRLLFSLLERAHSASERHVRQDSLEFEQLQVELYHVHLPKLEDEGYITWNKDEKKITTGPNWSDIEPLLRVIYDHLNELPPFLRGAPTTG